ncbi:hypothetical protein BV25DRAFT_1921291 [Artomyces pyxidatus]|uniref:Uncharacterized protein n=1 Tax=Artomyces pyxidatus TaxID=48021 RepID=A0ACB8SIJ7_9AGAM|nr:hypothetical protein BV25DRAFT_1921291 [Artomyces pyxidatus]
MRIFTATVYTSYLASTAAYAQSPLWGQCGGSGWNGATTCVSGATCTYENPYYSQCLPSSSSGGSTVSSQSISSTATSTSSSTPLPTYGAGGYIQKSTGTASFTHYSGCGQAACGKPATGYTAALSQLAFGSVVGLGPGDACGRCFSITANADAYPTNFTGPFATIVVKVTDMCPVQGNQEFCGQTTSTPINQHGMPVHFDLCEDTGAAAAFFLTDHGALTGNYTEISCSLWSGSDGSALWNGACLSGETAPIWPSVGCGNQGA